MFVVGGAGAIGGYVVPALVRAGHAVTALARTSEKAARSSEQGASPVVASIFDRAALTEAFGGHDAVVNVATAIPPTSKFVRVGAWAENDRVRGDGDGRVVQESVSMIYPDRGAAWIDEGCAPDDFPMARASPAAEASANRFSAAGGAGVVLRFGWFYGPGATHSEELFATARRRYDGYAERPRLVDPCGRRSADEAPLRGRALRGGRQGGAATSPGPSGTCSATARRRRPVLCVSATRASERQADGRPRTPARVRVG